MKPLIFCFLVLLYPLYIQATQLPEHTFSNHFLTLIEHHDNEILKLLSIIFSLVLLLIILWIRALKKHRIKLNKIRDELAELNQTLETRIHNEVEKHKQHQLMMLHQSRLSQMGDTLNMIAHQWRQPLNNLALINEVLLLRYRKNRLTDTTINEFKIESRKEIEEMSHTIDAFKDFFKPDKKAIEYNPKQIIKYAIKLIQPVFIHKKIELFIEYRDNSKLIGYPNELGQSIMHILNNAKDALLEKKLHKAREVYLSLYRQHNDIVITIKDNGGEIDSEVINHVFDPYFSTKSDQSAMGLGLYMSKMIIEEHMHGLLKVANNKEGTTFSIHLPLKVC